MLQNRLDKLNAHPVDNMEEGEGYYNRPRDCDDDVSLPPDVTHLGASFLIE